MGIAFICSLFFVCYAHSLIHSFSFALYCLSFFYLWPDSTATAVISYARISSPISCVLRENGHIRFVPVRPHRLGGYMDLRDTSYSEISSSSHARRHSVVSASWGRLGVEDCSCSPMLKRLERERERERSWRGEAARRSAFLGSEWLYYLEQASGNLLSRL